MKKATKYPKVGTLKRGTQFEYVKSDGSVEIATVGAKRAYDTEIHFKDDPNTYTIRKDCTVLVVTSKIILK